MFDLAATHNTNIKFIFGVHLHIAAAGDFNF